MKKLICILIICLSFCLFSVPSVAQSGFAITVGTLDKALDVKRGDEIVVPVYLSGNIGVYSYALEYSFDNSVLELQDDKMKQNGKGDYKCLINDFTTNNRGNNVIIVSLAGGSVDVTDNGVITYLFFKVKEDAKGGFCPINVTYKKSNVCNYAANALNPAKVNGGVYVNAPISSEPLNSSGSSSTPSASTNSSNTSSRPIGYVPQNTLPSTAPDYYSSVIASASSKEQSSSSEVSNVQNSSSDTNSTETLSQDSFEETPSTSSRWQIGNIEVIGGAISPNVLVAIITAGVVVIAGAIVSFVISNKKK